MKVTLDEVFQDNNGLWVVCYRTDSEWLRLRFTNWQGLCFWAQIKLRQFFGLPILPYTPPANVIVEYGLLAGNDNV
jgi:hypothetical protein